MDRAVLESDDFQFGPVVEVGWDVERCFAWALHLKRSSRQSLCLQPPSEARIRNVLRAGGGLIGTHDHHWHGQLAGSIDGVLGGPLMDACC